MSSPATQVDSHEEQCDPVFGPQTPPPSGGEAATPAGRAGSPVDLSGPGAIAAPISAASSQEQDPPNENDGTPARAPPRVQRTPGPTAEGERPDGPEVPAANDVSRVFAGAAPDPAAREEALGAARAVEALALTADACDPADRDAVHTLVRRLRDAMRDGFASSAAQAATAIAAKVMERRRISGTDIAPLMLDFVADARDARMRSRQAAAWPADVFIAPTADDAPVGAAAAPMAA